MHHARFTPFATARMRVIIPRAARRAVALSAETTASREDVCTSLRLDPRRFTVVPLGAEPIQRADPLSETATRSRFDLGNHRVVLCVGAKRPHKNQALLIRGLTQLPHDFRLVLVGHNERYEAVLR